MSSLKLYLMQTPKETDGTGILTDLSLSDGFSLKVTTDDIETFSVTMPSSHYHAAMIGLLGPGAVDAIITHDEDVIQRFACIKVQDAGGKMTATFSSYKEVFNNRLLHEGDDLDYPAVGGRSADDVAWLIIAEDQAKGTIYNVEISRGVVPTVALPDHPAYVPDTAEGTFFAPKTSRTKAINNILLVEDGADWAIEPDPDDPWRKLVFNTWNRGDRHTPELTSGLSTFVLDSKTMQSWTHVQSIRANMVGVTGAKPQVAAGDPPVPAPFAWRPLTEVPTLYPETGVWEQAATTDQPSQPQVNAFADETYADTTSELDEWQVTLQPGTWAGRGDFWLGDSMLMLLQVPTYNDAGEVTTFVWPDINQVMRITAITLVRKGGTDEVTLDLNKLSKTLQDRLYAIETNLDEQRRRV